MIEIKIIDISDADYKKELELRDEILRRPLGLSIYDDGLNEENDFHIAAYAQGALVGCAVLTPLDCETLRIRQAAVEERFQRKGIGAGLIGFSERLARQKGFRRLALHSRVSAAGFYEKLGYSFDGEQFIKIGVPHIKMFKEIKPFGVCLFDLDGTLTDPKEGITKAVQYALSHFNIYEPNPDKLVKFIGPPLRESFRNYYGFNDENIEEVAAKHREYFSDKGIFQNRVYEGAPSMLKALKESGKTLALATSKPEVFAKRILEKFELSEYFSVIAGSEIDGTRSNKGEVIAYALSQIGGCDKSAAVMIGDREHDIAGAKEAGIASIGVNYGYGTSAELENCGADYIVSSVKELEKLLTF